MKCLGLFVLACAGVVLATMWKGYVLSILWAWFVVQAFGLPAIGVAQAIGLSLVIFMLTVTSLGESSKEEPFDAIAKAVLMGFFLPLFLLGAGWVVKQYL